MMREKISNDTRKQLIVAAVTRITAHAMDLGFGLPNRLEPRDDGKDPITRFAEYITNSPRASDQLDFYTNVPVWGADVSVAITVTAPEGDPPRASAKVSWSSTGRTIAQAMVAIKNYQTAVDLAAFAEAMLS